jgi:hypothetical protein
LSPTNSTNLSVGFIEARRFHGYHLAEQRERFGELLSQVRQETCS